MKTNGLIISFSAISVFLLALASYQIAFADRVYPWVKFLGTNLTFKDKTEVASILNQKISQLINQKITLRISSEETKDFTLLLSDLGVNFDEQSLIKDAFNHGRHPDPILNSIAALYALINPRELVPHLIINQDKLEEISKQVSSPPQNASLVYEEGQIKIQKEEGGYSIDIEDLSRKLTKRIKEADFTPINLKLKFQEPTIQTPQVLEAKAYLEKVTLNPLILLSEGKQFNISAAEIFSWFDLAEKNIENKPVLWASLNDLKVKSSLAKIAKKIEIKPIDQKVLSDGNVEDPGRDGLAVDQVATLNQIKTQLETDNHQIALATKVIPKNTKVVQPEATPGLFAGKYIEIDLSSQTLYLFENDQQIGHFTVSTGKWSMPTPSGTFAINNKTGRAYSARYNLYMPYWMSFIGGKYGIHELPEWANGVKEGQSHLGTPVSHGCVRLGVGDAEQVYNWAEISTPVYIHA